MAWVAELTEQNHSIRVGFLVWNVFLGCMDMPHAVHFTALAYGFHGLHIMALYLSVSLLSMLFIERRWFRTKWWGLVVVACAQGFLCFVAKYRGRKWPYHTIIGLELCEFYDSFMWASAFWCNGGAAVAALLNALLLICGAVVEDEEKKRQ
eukprot:gnl/TRDRNA2_/TRDRNA2_194308_c0_seq1.p1 gnl/TRDRNA2_/TRDRNA2_194308_c0~~gnl/TRDRNA2_/TRDRNA2_194308_c0_seq1.p1  ORF type:complete len:151 (+),score=17.76 gnl/TRDRNA2_/TRDRNA2_194308_c0_seq1:60-512(+)